MKVSELMIGDLVYSSFSDIPCKVQYLELCESGYGSVKTTNVDGLKDIASLSPIPLTPEILEKNGFEKQQGYFGSVFAFDDDDKDTHVIIHPKENNYTRGAYTYIHVEHGCLSLDELPLEYIHELQHALKLCGIEKQIEL